MQVGEVIALVSTGSGKTITSFKTALFLSTRAGFDKVVFLVDRTELDQKTSEEFKAYAAYESVTVDDTKYTFLLKKHITSPGRGIIVTTTHKLNSLIKDLEESKDYNLAKKKIVFIIDEAHRTTMGDMMGNITSYFKNNGNNALFYGFTGTPLFDENQITGRINEKDEVIDTTEKLFGPELHSYRIDEAIADGNVLGFNVDYINTGEFLSHDDLRQQIIEDIKTEKPDKAIREIEREVQKWEEVEVEEEAKKRNILEYHDDTHIPRVVEEILSNWEFQSQEREFNAILTVGRIDRVIKYYNEFKKQMKEQPSKKINIAMTFSSGNEGGANDSITEEMRTMFKDYAEFTGIEFVYGDRRQGENNYYEDLVARGTRGGSGRNEANIDLIIVADQLLTGYDSRFLNTLYVDKTLKLQNLIQAYSRTNRVHGKNKEFGTIINYKYPRITERSVNKALKLYGSGGKSSKVIVEHYETAVEKLVPKVKKMIETLSNPTDWELLQTDEMVKESFLLAFRDANDQLNTVRQYYKFQWDDITFGIDEHTWLRYIGAYKNLTYNDEEPEEEVIVNPLVGKTKLSGTQIIDADHILKLIGSKVKTENGIQTADKETLRIIYEQIQELSNMGENEQAKLMKEFVETELEPGNLSSSMDFDESFDAWKRSKMEEEVKSFARDWGIDVDLLLESLESFSIIDKNIPYINEIHKNIDFRRARNQNAGDELTHKMILINEVLPNWFIKIKQKYN